MPTFHDPLADAAEASEALRGLAHASRVFDDPADTYAVFGAMADKDIDGIIAHMKDHVDHWCVTDLPAARAASAADIAARLSEAGVNGAGAADAEHSIGAFASPAEAYANARSRAGENDRIAVFGSFLTVAGVIAARKSEYH